jgi:hypothetical protein
MARQAQVGYSKRSRLDKLGVKKDMRIALLGVADGAILRELRTRTKDVALTRPKKDTDMVIVGFDDPGRLKRLATLRGSIARNGAIWAVWPKGQTHINGNMVRAAALANGLVDIKVMAFSETLSALKLVIPVAKR